jgi:hypothetical protein
MNKTTDQIPPQNGVVKKKKLAMKEYEIAISLMEYHTNLLWLEFGAFLLAETILLGILGQMVIQEERQWLPIIFISIFGLILCIPWWATFEHNYKYYRLRIEEARKLEPVLGFSLLSDGSLLSRGETIPFDKECLRLCFLARLLPPRRAVPFMIIFFVIIFISLPIISSLIY